MKTIQFLFLIILASACYSGMDDDYSYIDPQIKPYFDAFIKEASDRNITIDTYSIKMTFAKIDVEGRQGNTSHRHHEIKIDSSGYRWKEYPESIVFHELGHLLLNRSHNNYRINFNPTSIMDSNEIPEYELGRPELRKYYMDELFDPSTPVPDGF